jgi:ribosomal 50S subunit-recycling heat shock protein
VQVTVLAKDPVTGQTQLVSNSQTYGVDATGNPDSALVLDPVAGDNVINGIEANNLNTAITGTMTGEFVAGDVVSVYVNAKTFTAAVNAQGQFSVSVPTTQLLQDADSKIETSAQVTTAAGLVTTTAAQDYSVDTTPPVARVSVNNLTPDNLISAQEAVQATLPVTGKVIGEFRSGDVVSVSVNNKTFTTTVDEQGNYSVPVPTTDLIADSYTQLQVSVLPTDAAGNPGQRDTAVLDYATTGLTPFIKAAVVFDPVEGDNIISLTEARNSASNLTGKVTGEFRPGDVVTVSINTRTVTGTVNALGEFSIPVYMWDLKDDADKTVAIKKPTKRCRAKRAAGAS